MWVTYFLLGTEGCSVLGSPRPHTASHRGVTQRASSPRLFEPSRFPVDISCAAFFAALPVPYGSDLAALPSPPLRQGARPPCERCAPLRLAHLCREIAGTRRKRALSSPRGGCEDKNTECSWAPSRAAAFSWRLGRERLALTWKFYFSWSKSCSRLLSGLQRVTELF